MKSVLNCFGVVLIVSIAGWNSSTLAETKVEDALARDMPTKMQERVIVLMRPDPDVPNGGKSISAPASYLQGVLGSNTMHIKQIGRLPAVAVELNAEGLKQLAEDPNVVKILRDVPMKPHLMDSVPLIGADALHKAGYKGVSTSVAILDTGIDPQHPALKDSVVAQACFSTTESKVYKLKSLCPNKLDVSLLHDAATGCPPDAEGCEHGTHVAGIVAGRNMSFNNKIFTGVAPAANVVAIQVFTLFEDDSLCGEGNKCIMSFTSDQLRALDWVYKNRDLHKIAAVNMSLGSGYFDKPCDSSSALTEIIERLKVKGIPTVVSAGNEGYYDGVSEPACISHAYAVTATNKTGKIDTDYSNISKQVRFAAPGTAIISSVFGKTYKALSGTSMAAPHVAGAFALLREEFPKMSLKLLERKLDPSDRTVQDPKTGDYFKVLALKGDTELQLAEGSVQQSQALSNGSIRAQDTINTQQSEALVAFPSTGSVIVTTPSHQSGDETVKTLSKSLESVPNVDTDIKRIGPNSYKIDISPNTRSGLSEKSAGEAAVSTSEAIKAIKAIEGVRVYDNRLAIPK